MDLSFECIIARLSAPNQEPIPGQPGAFLRLNHKDLHKILATLIGPCYLSCEFNCVRLNVPNPKQLGAFLKKKCAQNTMICISISCCRRFSQISAISLPVHPFASGSRFRDKPRPIFPSSHPEILALKIFFSKHCPSFFSLFYGFVDFFGHIFALFSIRYIGTSTISRWTERIRV